MPDADAGAATVASVTSRLASGDTTPRERILEAAIDLLYRDGEAGLRVDSVIESAGVARQSVYHHFGDREGLLVAALAERYRRALTSSAHPIIDAMMMCVNEDDYFRLIVANINQMLHEGGERRMIRIQALGAATSRPVLHAAIQEAHRSAVLVTTKIFAFGQVRGWMNRAHTAETLCELWFAVVTGFHMPEAYAEADTAPLVGPALLDMICLLLFGRVPPASSGAASVTPDSTPD